MLLDGIQKVLGYGTDDEDSKAKDYLSQSTDAFNNIPAPLLTPVDLENYNYEGDVAPQLVTPGADVNYQTIDPELAAAVNQGDTEMNNVSVDPRLRDQQLQGLAELQRIYSSGGLTPEDRAQLSQIEGEVSQADRGRRGAIKQGMASRGMGGSGMDLLAQLQSEQAATDRAAQQGLDVAAQANSRKLQALLDSGSLAGSLRGQDFGEKSAIAEAQDAINRFNAANRTSVNQFNSGVKNSTNQFNSGNQLKTDTYNRDTNLNTQQFNAGQNNQMSTQNRNARQGVSNANTELHNKQKTFNNVDLPQQNFDNQYKIASGKSGAAGAGVNYYNSKAQQKNNMFGNLIAGGAQVGAAALSDKREKKNISEIHPQEMEAFLATISPKKYEYKDEGHGQGKYVGPMAQDLLKSAIGSDMVVQDDSGTLGYDTQKMQGMHTAAIKYLADELAKLKKKAG